MTMFRELYALATNATLTMIVSADEQTGKLTISVLPKPKKDLGELALTKDLTLTASPEDFDAGFLGALQGYRETRASLTAQAEATREVLAAAKSASAKKANEATAKVAKPTAEKSAPSPHAGNNGDEGGETGDSVGSQGQLEPARGESLSLFG